jgi:streptogramin lyase
MLKQAAATAALIVAMGIAVSPVAVNAAGGGIRVLPSDTVQLRAPRSISVSAEGVLYVADTGHHRIVAVDSAGKLVAETGGFGSGHGQFQWPSLVVADRGNSVWVLDYGNRRIEKFSRLLEYQGTLEILVAGDDNKHQPQALAVSPLGDLYVYDRDDSRLVRYDPLLQPQAELSASRGARAVSNITTMIFWPGHGLYWWSPENAAISRADAWLNLGQSIPFAAKPEAIPLASDDSVLVCATERGILRWSDLTMHADTLLAASRLAQTGIQKVTALAFSARHDLFVLDGTSGTVFLFRRSED